jgi:pimeloyl-ACP methyl ester carboxylesterase
MAPAVGAVFARVRRDRDLVLVDQRGTGKSNPLNCRPESDSLQLELSDEAAVANLHKCLAGFDADVRLYTTSIAMDDLDDVRRHLGYERINLYGGSYGTRAALVYLRQHGAFVRSVVLDGVAPTGMRLPLFAARDAGQALSALFEDCDRDARCRSAFPKMADRTAVLIARLERAPLETSVVHPRTGATETVRITPRAAANGILASLYSPTTAAILPALLDRAERNDFQPLLALALARDDDNMSLGMQLSVLCSEDASRFAEDDVRRETSGRLLGRHLLSGQMLACDIWPKGEVPASYFEPVRSDVPALVLSGELDPVTPPTWGADVVQHLSRGRHLIAADTGHGVAQTACGARVVADFIAAGRTDGLDTACLERGARPPFFLGPSGPDPLAGAPGAPQ